MSRARSGVIVRMQAAGQELDFGIGFQKVDRLHAGRKIGSALAARPRCMSSDEAVQINGRLGNTVRITHGFALTVLGYPESAC